MEEGETVDKVNVALIFLNSNYEDPEFCDLPGANEEGEMMTKMLKNYTIFIAENTNDFEAKLLELKECEAKDLEIGRIHFHFSGHVVYNEDDEKAPIGHCLVGTSGKLITDLDLKKRLLEWRPENLTVTYDCIRGQAPMQLKVTSFGLKARDLQKMFTLCATVGLNRLSNSPNSLTKELYKVTLEGSKPLVVKELAAAINSSWQERGVEDLTCHEEMVPDYWTHFTWPTRKSKLSIAVMFFNAKYKLKSPLNDLEYVKADEACMRTMLESYDEMYVVNDADNIREELHNIEEEAKMKEKQIGRLHFHFSGHGMRYDNFQTSVDADTKLGDFCVVGTSLDLKLYPGYLLKSKLLSWKPEKLTISLDCCRGNDDLTRNFNSSGGQPLTRAILTPNEDRLASSNAELKKVCVLYATVDRHKASDKRSFTQELYKVTKKGTKSIPINDICKDVNKSWSGWTEGNGSTQLCTAEIFDDGDNWKGYMWPTGTSRDSDEGFISSSKLDQVLVKLDTFEIRQESMEQSMEKLDSIERKQDIISRSQISLRKAQKLMAKDQESMQNEIEVLKKKKKPRGLFRFLKGKSLNMATKGTSLESMNCLRESVPITSVADRALSAPQGELMDSLNYSVHSI